jgi:hypothetical protein
MGCTAPFVWERCSTWGVLHLLYRKGAVQEVYCIFFTGKVQYMGVYYT